MSHYKPYPAYKDSGIEWLGKVPEHWTYFKVGRNAPFSIGWTPPTGDDASYGDDCPWVCISDMGSDFIDNTAKGLSTKALHAKGARPLPVGTLLFSFKLTVGSVSFLRVPAVTNEAIAAFPPMEAVDLRFFFYAAPQFIPKFGRENIYGSLLLNQELIQSAATYFPHKNEQKTIAFHLDRETAQIDALIAKKTRFIELLREKRQALITHAVTKGLDPSVKLKDSGVEWLGEVPEHWDVLQLRHTARLESGHTPSRSKPEYWVDCTVPWFTLADVWQVRSGEQRYVSETSEKVSQLGLESSSARLLPAGSVFLSRTASVGFTGIMAVDMATSQDFAVWTCANELFNEYLYYVLLGMKPDFERLMMGSTHKTIYMPDIEAIRIARPPVDEQRGIVSALSGQLGLFKSVIDKTERSIALLKERRAALITAAVTGQIDLREAV